MGDHIYPRNTLSLARSVICLILLFNLGGCGYWTNGTWEDDPDNWDRAFQSRKPEDVTILHSYFSRSPHWTYEFSYFFEIERNEALQEQLFSQNNLVLLDVNQAIEARNDLFENTPKWFAPKPIDHYEVWVYADQPESNFHVLIDKETGNIFISDIQL